MNCSGDATKRGRRGIALCAFVSGHKAGHIVRSITSHISICKTPPSSPYFRHGDLLGLFWSCWIVLVP